MRKHHRWVTKKSECIRGHLTQNTKIETPNKKILWKKIRKTVRCTIYFSFPYVHRSCPAHHLTDDTAQIITYIKISLWESLRTATASLPQKLPRKVKTELLNQTITCLTRTNLNERTRTDPLTNMESGTRKGSHLLMHCTKSFPHVYEIFFQLTYGNKYEFTVEKHSPSSPCPKFSHARPPSTA